MKIGYFSERDAEKLRPYLNALRDLVDGIRPPKTAAQGRFIKVARRKIKPKTEYEFAFLRWLDAGRPDLDCPYTAQNVAAKSAPAFRNPTKGGLADRAARKNAPKPTPATQSLRNTPKNDPELEKLKNAEAGALEALRNQPKFKRRKVEEPWGSRDAWKRDRALNKYNSR